MSTPTGSSGKRGLLVAALIVLAIPIVLPLLVGTYAREEPRLAGIPFFFWYQFALIPVSAVLTFVAYRLVLVVEKDRHRSSGKDGDRR